MNTEGKINGMFWIHAIITSLAWVGPFLFNWKVMCIAYLLVYLQFQFLGKCVLNKSHGIEEEDYNTIYAFILESMGFNVNKKAIHFFIRNISKPMLVLFTICWQVLLGFKPLIF